jgi:hypothetical protein
MTKDEALDLALAYIQEVDYGPYDSKPVITAIKQARALDKMAENARELGLDYEPVVMPENWFAGMPEEYRKEAWRVATPPAAQPAPVQEHVAFKQFLSDVHTAAGLVTHGKQCKALGERLGEGVMRYYMATSPAAQPSVPDAIHHTDLSEHPQYIEGWNDCRAEMLKGMK